MKKIFWGIQSLVGIGGTETVSIKLMNLLSDYYEIHLISTAKIDEKISYKLDKRIVIHSLNIPLEVIRFDETFLKNNKDHKFFKNIALIHKVIKYFIFKRNKIRKSIKNMMDVDSFYIGSAIDSYMYAPKIKNVFYHFHFDAKRYFGFINKVVFKLSTKPRKIIFLAKSIEEEVLKKRKKLINKTTYIYNPIRFSSVYSNEYHNNSLIFVGRFSEQKNPLFALKIAKILHDKDFNFSFKMYGEGHYLDEMNKFKDDYNLTEVKIINHHVVSQNDYLNSDLLVFTSIYEGFPLVIGEANSASLPVISTNWHGTINESIDNGKSGWIIDSNDPNVFADMIIRILNNKSKLIETKKNAYEFSKRLDDKNIVRKWVDLLK